MRPYQRILLGILGLATAETAIPSKPSKNFLIFKSDRSRPPYYGQMGYRTRKKRWQASPPLYRHPSILNFHFPRPIHDDFLIISSASPLAKQLIPFS
jgi:hypothetical protein